VETISHMTCRGGGVWGERGGPRLNRGDGMAESLLVGGAEERTKLSVQAVVKLLRG